MMMVTKRIDDNGVISFTFDDPNDDPDMGIITVEIGEVDVTSNGTNGLLRINLYGDATTPGSGNLLNGDFETLPHPRIEYSGIENVMSANGLEHRDGMIETVNVIAGEDALGNPWLLEDKTTMKRTIRFLLV